MLAGLEAMSLRINKHICDKPTFANLNYFAAFGSLRWSLKPTFWKDEGLNSCTNP